MSEIFLRSQVVSLREAGFTYAQIKQRTGKGRNYVRRWVRRHQEQGSVERKQGSGRPKMLTDLVLQQVSY